MPWVGVLVATVVVCLHLYLAERPGQEVRLIVLAVFMGLVFDSLLVQSGWLQYAGGSLLTGTAPYWILMMWALFATTLNVSMSWLKNMLGVSIVLGIIAGPLSYMGGARLGGLEFVDFYKGIVALMFVWALAMPLLMLATRRFNGIGKQEPVLPTIGLTNG
jgi:hypothetical protein